MSYEELKLENQICHRLYIASNGLTRLYRPLLKELDLTYAQYVIMMGLWECDGITMGKLASKTQIDKGFLTTSIEAMKEKKLLIIKTDENDKRKKLINLSARGKKLEEKAKKIPHKIIEMFSEKNSTEEEVMKFIKTLDKVNHLIAEKLGE